MKIQHNLDSNKIFESFKEFRITNESKIGDIQIQIEEILDDKNTDIKDIAATSAKIAKILPIKIKQDLLREKIETILTQYNDELDSEQLSRMIVKELF